MNSVKYILTHCQRDHRSALWKEITNCKQFPLHSLDLICSLVNYISDEDRANLYYQIALSFSSSDHKESIVKALTIILPDSQEYCDHYLSYAIDSIKNNHNVQVALALFYSSSKRASASLLRSSFIDIINLIIQMDGNSQGYLFALIKDIVIKFDQALSQSEFKGLCTIIKRTIANEGDMIVAFLRDIFSNQKITLIANKWISKLD